MKIKKHPYYLQLIVILILSLNTSCISKESLDVKYTIQTAININNRIEHFDEVTFNDEQNLDLGFFKGNAWIKLKITSGKERQSLIVLCNDLINRNYRFYKLDTATKSLNPIQKVLDHGRDDDRTYNFSKPNFQINLEPLEVATYFISTTSDGRILQASPRLISLNEFLGIKQQTIVFDILFYSLILLILLINLFYFRLIRSDIYYYYGAYIVTGCLMYLFVEGRLYGLGLSIAAIDHLMFISIRLWVLTVMLFTVRFLEIKITHPGYYKFIMISLAVTLSSTTLYQLVFSGFSISTLHKTENLIGFVWIIMSLVTVGIGFKRRKTQSIYYLISYSTLLIFVTLGLIDSHTTILPGDPFSYFKIGTILEFIGFTYFITLLIKQKLRMNERLQRELSINLSELREKEKLLASKETDLVSVFSLIENSFNNESDWEDFKERFNRLNPKFITSVSSKHIDLTKSEIRLLTLVRIGYSQKEIAKILNIAPDSVKKARTRLRKKLELPDSIHLQDYLTNI